MSDILKTEVKNKRDELMSQRRGLEREIEAIDLQLSGLDALLGKKSDKGRNSNKRSYYKNPLGLTATDLAKAFLNKIDSGNEFSLYSMKSAIEVANPDFRGSAATLQHALETLNKEGAIRVSRRDGLKNIYEKI